MQGGKNTSKETPKRLRFSADDDLAVLREFVSQNPLEDPEKWDEIQRNILIITGKRYAIRTLKDHLFLLLEMWLRKDARNQVKSGVEEVYSERDHLLQEISDMCKNGNINLKRRKVTSKEKQIADLGRKAREECASMFNIEITKTDKSNEANTMEIFDHDYLKDTFPITVEVGKEIEMLSNEVFLKEIQEESTPSDAPKCPLQVVQVTEQKKRILGPKKNKNQ